MEKVTITFAGGDSIEAEKNGGSFIVDEPFEEKDLSEVTIEGAEETTVLHDAELIECASVDGRYWFTLREITEAEAEAVQLRADVDYLLAITE